MAQRLADVAPTDDPVRDLAALGAAYTANALDNPALYRAMFDTVAELEDPQAADRTFQLLVAAAGRARTAGRFNDTYDPETISLRFWASVHGVTMLALTGVLPRRRGARSRHRHRSVHRRR